MSNRRPLLLLALALWSAAVSHGNTASAQTAATATATPAQTEGEEAQAPDEATSAPEGMVFDPTTGRYMPVSEQLPWRNSFFIFDNSVNHTGLDNSTLSNTSYWVQTYSLRPRWNFTDTLSLRFRQDIYAELVAASTTSEHQPVVSDTQLDLVEAALVTWEGVIIGAGGRLLLPTSLASRNADRVVGTGAQTSATKVFSNVMEGLVTQVSASYQHWWASGTTPSGYDPGSTCIADNTQFTCSNFRMPTAVRDQITAGLVGQLSFTPDLSAGLAFAWLWQRGAGLDEVLLSATGAQGGTGSLTDEQTHWRNLTSSSVFVSYQVNSWLQASLGMNSLTPQLNPNGSVRNPFWNPDTQYSLTATLTLDQLYTTIVDSSR